jgi:hypothetical protein
MDFNFIKNGENEFELKIIDYETQSIVTIPSVVFDEPKVIKNNQERRGGVGNHTIESVNEYDKVDLKCKCYPNKNGEIWIGKHYRNYPKSDLINPEYELFTLKTEIDVVMNMLRGDNTKEEILRYLKNVTEDWDD